MYLYAYKKSQNKTRKNEKKISVAFVINIEQHLNE